HEPERPRPLPAAAELVDERSGVRIVPGRLVVVVSGVPDDSAALADRLGRYLPDTGTPPSLDVDDSLKGGARRAAKAEMAQLRRARAVADEEQASARWGVSLGGVDLSELSLAELRRHVLVSDTSSQVFAGTLQQAVDPHGRASREQAEEALRVASAEDVYEALPGGWQGVLDERGRGLSGGQRQRVVLARALLMDAPVLVLVEPTSAVDAHTEARIAERVTRYRAGRSTVVMTVSPLWLHHADEVLWLEDGRLAGQGSHSELLAEPGYRRVVARGMETSGV
uniref:ATP-binding cassette domain-containing protein n=1 Tax=Desertihabitans aurantiacus TaxID=2282477 RepID=UPI0013008235